MISATANEHDDGVEPQRAGAHGLGQGEVPRPDCTRPCCRRWLDLAELGLRLPRSVGTQPESVRIASDNPEELKMNLQGIFLSQSRGGILKR